MKYTINYQNQKIEIEKLPNGKYKKPDIAQFTTAGRGCCWMDDCRIPYANASDEEQYNKCCEVNGKYETGLTWGGKKVLDVPSAGRRTSHFFEQEYTSGGIDPKWEANNTGRFPANLLCENNVLDEKPWKMNGGVVWSPERQWNSIDKREGDSRGRLPANLICEDNVLDNDKSFSRFFSLDAWWNKKIKELPEGVQKTFPFLITPKPSKKEKNKGLDNIEPKQTDASRKEGNVGGDMPHNRGVKPVKNNHPTVKSIKLMSWLITLGSREKDIVLDPFAGSGTTGLAAEMLDRRFIGIEQDAEYAKIARARKT